MTRVACIDCVHQRKGGLRGPGCARTRYTAFDLVSGTYEQMRRCEAERDARGRLLDRLFHPERLPCGPEGRHFELAESTKAAPHGGCPHGRRGDRP